MTKEGKRVLFGYILIVIALFFICAVVITYDSPTKPTPTVPAVPDSHATLTPTTPAPVLPPCSVALKMKSKPTCQFVNPAGETKVWTHEEAVNADEEFNKLPHDKAWHEVIALEKAQAKQDKKEATLMAKYPNASLAAYTERESLAAAILQRSVLDPKSLTVDRVYVTVPGGICMDFRARNGFGGMAQGRAVLIPDTEQMSFDASTYNRHCSGTFGWDDKDAPRAFSR